MSLLNNKNIDLTTLNESQLKTLINDTNREIKQLNKQINALQLEIDKTNEQFNLELDDLNRKQDAFLRKLDNQNRKLNKELIKLEKQQNDTKDSYEETIAQINEKIEQQKLKKKKLMKQKADLDTQAFVKKKDSIDKRLKQLRNSKKDEELAFNDKMSAIKEEYESLIGSHTVLKSNIEEKINDLKISSTKQINDLNRKLEDVEYQKNESLKFLQEVHTQKQNEIARKEEEKLQAKINEYNSVDNERKALEKTRDDFIRQMNLENDKNEKEYQKAIADFENKKDQIMNSNNELSDQIDNIQRLISENKVLYANNIKKFEEELSLYSASKDEEITEIKKRIKQIKPDLNTKFDEYIASLQDEYDLVKNKNDENLKILKYNLNQEETRLQSRNEYLDTRLNNRQKKYQESIDKSSNEINILKQNFSAMKSDYNKKIKQLNEELENAKENSEKTIEDTRASYDEALKNTKKEYLLKNEKINNDITSVKERIGQLNKEIAQSQKDAEAYNSEYQVRKLNLDREQKVFLADIEDKNEQLQSRFDALQEKKNKNDRNYQNHLDELEGQKNDVIAEYNNRIASLQEEFENKTAEYNLQHQNNIENAINEHNEKLANLNNNYEKQIQNANDSFEQAKQDYEDRKLQLDIDIDRITVETDQKIEELKQERVNLSNSIDGLVVDLKAKQVEHDQQMAELDLLKQQKIQEIVVQHEKMLEQIYEEYEVVPSNQLQEIKDELALKQVEYNENAVNIQSRKQAIDDEEADAIRKSMLQKEVADNKYLVRNEEFEKFKKDIENDEMLLNEDLTNRQAQLEDYKEELNQQILSYKERKQNELDQLVKKQENDLEAKKQQYLANEKVVEKQYDDKIKAYQDDLEVKKSNINSLMNEIDLRRKSVEQQNTDRYNDAVAQTQDIQKQLDDMINNNEIRRSELAKALNQKKEMIESELSEVSENYNTILNEKKQAYEEYARSVQEKCENLRNDITNLENQKTLETSRIQTYEEEKKHFIENNHDETEKHIANIAKQIENIGYETQEIEKTHRDRVVFIKEQIASTMTEYDNLLRIKPGVFDDIEKQHEESLMERTREFKNSLDELEKNHQQILATLAKQRDDVISDIELEIENLDLTRTNKLKEFEEEIINIASAYDAMLKDEQNKQDVLYANIQKASQEQEEFILSMQNQDLSVIADYETEKGRLSQIHEDNMQDSIEQFDKLTENLKKEFDELLSQRQDLSNEIQKLLETNRSIDEQIVKDELQLKYKCNSMLFDAKRILEFRQNERKEELSKLDTLSNKDNINIFDDPNDEEE